ncbi:MAG: CYTH domain-containing protein [Chloroflexota bacterium]
MVLRSKYRYSQIETERRYLLQHLPNDLPENYIQIIDLYIPDTRLRLRRMIDQQGKFIVAKFTQKYAGPEQGAHERHITNIYLEEQEMDALACLTGAIVSKRRHSYKVGDIKYSIDFFTEHLEGLIICDLDHADAGDMPAPAFAHSEVTEDNFFNGGNLAGIQPNDLTTILDKYFS